MIYKNIHKIIRRYSARLIHQYKTIGSISERQFSDCSDELLSVFNKTPKVCTYNYRLLDDKQGLYVKSNKDFYNPCFVVAGGPSLNGFDFEVLKDKVTIVSNKSIFDVPNPNYFITTDYTFLNYMKKVNLYKNWLEMEAMKFFVVNCISDVIQNKNGVITDTRYNLKYELQDFNKIIICKSAKSMGYNFDNFNSGYNSGFSSFQLAVLLGYNPIYLLGFDMCSSNNDTHYHGGYGKNLTKMNQNLDNYSKHFLTILERLKIEKPELKIISCSKNSLLNKIIEYKPIGDIL